MIKKLLLIAVGGIVVTGVCFGGAAVSYFRTSVKCLSDSVQDAVPVGFQIDRARQMISDLDPQIRRNMHLIAKEEVELDNLAKQIETTESHSSKDKDHILTMKSDLTGNQNVFRYAGRSYSREQVQTDLIARFKRFKTNQATLDSLRRVHDARGPGLAAARTKLEGLMSAKRQLLIEVENLEAQRQMVDAAKTTASYQFDDSHLGRIKELIADLQARLDTDRKLIDAETSFSDEIPMDEVEPDNVVDEVTAYFGLEKADAANLATK